MKEDSHIERKIYSRDYLISLFYCPKLVPAYLLSFPELLKSDEDNMWCKKPLPKFDEVVDSPRYKTNHSNSNYKGRQRTTSNHSGENNNESEVSSKVKPQKINSAMKLKTEKYNRYNIINESQSGISDNKELVDDNGWKTVESKVYKAPNTFSKQYVSNYQGPENHWKKWGKDRPLGDDKAASTYHRNEKTNNFIVQKVEQETKLISKVNQSLSAETDQTEDIWQDDWDTEMQSKITTTSVESLEYYELPPSSITVSHTSEAEKSRNNNLTDIDFNLWFYKDLSGNDQGPFTSERMANWLATGYFDYATSLRRKCDERFLLLAEYRTLYGRIPFTIGHTIPAILQDTSIEIDVNQLIVGVDISIMQKVLANATSLSKQNIPLRNNNVSPDNIDTALSTIEIDKQAIIEEKRRIEDSKAELERERQRIYNEQEEWKIRMENELNLRVQSLFEQQTKDLNKTISALNINAIPVEESKVNSEEVTQVNTKGVNIIEHSDVEAVENIGFNNDHQSDKNSDQQTKVKLEEKEEIMPSTKEESENKDINMKNNEHTKKKSDIKLQLDDLKSGDWLSTKDIKSKKNKKAKNKSTKQSIEVPLIPLSEDKKIILGVSKVLKASGIVNTDEVKKVVKISDCLPSQVIASWNLKPTVLNIEQPKHLKSLLEIQAEEAQNEKLKQELDDAINMTKMEANKITSFKESLLKNVKPISTPIIPPGKSIWDVAETADVFTPECNIKTLEINVVKRSAKKSSDNNNNESDDGLLSWCYARLNKVKKNLDVLTLVELLKEVPCESVMDLTVELLGDSEFSKNFAKDFIKRRQDFNMSIMKDDTWQTVKKSQIGTPVVNNTNANNKKSKKKKMVVVDHIKFRSS